MTKARSDRFGVDFKSFTLAYPLAEHKALRMKALEFGVSVAEVARMALADDALWRKAAREKARGKAAK